MGIEQSDVQDMNQSTSTSSSGNYANNQSQVFVIGSASVDYISNHQNPTKSDINALLLLDTRAAETALSTQQGSKRSTPALAAKTASVSTRLSDKKAVKKISGDPGDPGASLPIGDGVWVLLAFAAAYSVSRFAFRVSCSR
jgi:D-serine deaminase-like pyridoxal phosphate-dependent protein